MLNNGKLIFDNVDLRENEKNFYDDDVHFQISLNQLFDFIKFD